jgi:hypothetical protein
LFLAVLLALDSALAGAIGGLVGPASSESARR